MRFKAVLWFRHRSGVLRPVQHPLLRAAQHRGYNGRVDQAHTDTLIDGRYRVLGELGRGGTATVYRVTDESTGRLLALKRLRDGDPADNGDRSRRELRFRYEFHTVARLRHPCVIEAYDYGIDEGVPYYTMELLEGRDLEQLCPVDPAKACQILHDVAAALAFLHTKGLVHRDITPGNVKCTAGGRAKLIDFGIIGTIGVSADIAGTPPFMAPEVLRGLPVDHRADMFGLGALAYWLLTGRHAYRARSIAQLEGAWRHAPVAPSSIVPEIPELLDRLVLSLLNQDPLARPHSAAEVIARLAAIADIESDAGTEVASSYLASATLVGRRDEMERLRRAVARDADERGSAVVIEAPSGVGKSRLLREVALEAQIAGAIVVSVGGEALGLGPYGLLQALARELLAAAPGRAGGRCCVRRCGEL